MKKDEEGGWMFEDADRKAFADILKKFDSKQVESFLTMLEFICFQMKYWQELPTYQDVKEYANPVLHTFNKTIHYLNLLEKDQIAKGIPFGYPEFVGSDREAEDKRHSSKYVLDIINNAKTSRISLEELKTQIERQLQAWKSPPHRPSADSESFIFDIAKRYYEYFQEMPATTIEGTFYNVVYEALKLVNLPYADPRRKIKQAVNKLKATKAP